MRHALVLFVAACTDSSSPSGPGSSGEAPPNLELPPLGTFCYTLDGTESCAPDSVITTRVLDEGRLWFRVAATLTLTLDKDTSPEPTLGVIRVSGDLDPEAPLPAHAGRIAVQAPAATACRRVTLIDPFGTCAMREIPVVCNLDAVGDEGELRVQILDDTQVGATFSAKLHLDKPSCCASSPQCANPMEQLDPTPLTITGRFLQPFTK